jgi:hypothetical protein
MNVLNEVRECILINLNLDNCMTNKAPKEMLKKSLLQDEVKPD